MKSLRPYVFFFPYRGVGGVPVLFLRIAEWLAEKTEIPLYIIDYPDGLMATTKKNSNIQLLEYDIEKQIQIPKNAILIFQSDLPWGLPQNLVVDASVTAFFWNCYPFNLIPVLPGMARDWMSESLFKTKLLLNSLLLPAKKQCLNFLNLLLNREAIVFMDSPNVKMTELGLGVSIKDARFLPVVLPDIFRNSTKNLNDDSTLTGAWVGRVADFKVYSLLHVLERIELWTKENNKSFTFKIIGDGDRISEIKNFASKQRLLKVEFLGSLNPVELNTVLENEIDILFAMGTSALEGARLSIPTVLLDFSYGRFPENYKFKWLFETQNFSLGSPLDLIDIGTGKSISNILSDLYQNYGRLKSQHKEYFRTHHLIDSNMDSFFTYSQNSKFQYLSFLEGKLKNKPSYYKLWGLLKRKAQRS